jgi:selenocysteine lyase/cysteine desulfurase
MGGPPSNRVGFLYVAEEHIDTFQPMFVGNQALKEEQLQKNVYDNFDLYNFEYRQGMERFQIYPPYEFTYVVVENSMRILLKHGIEKIERWIKKLGTLLVEGMVEAGFDLHTPRDEARRLYVNVRVKEYRELEKELYKNNIKVSARVGGLRVSPHFYNKEEEIEAFLAQLKELTK